MFWRESDFLLCFVVGDIVVVGVGAVDVKSSRLLSLLHLLLLLKHVLLHLLLKHRITLLMSGVRRNL